MNDTLGTFDMKKQIGEMEEIVADTVFNISHNAESKVDSELKTEIKNFLEISSRTYAILNKIVNYTDQKNVSAKDFDTQMLIWQGMNTMISALQLTRQGYTLEPQFLIRPAVENLALALSFYTEGDYYEKFNKLQLSGEKAITPAKKLVKQMGGIYGILSEVTHPSKKTLGYYYMENRGKLGTLLIGGGVTDETMHRVKLNLAILNFVSTIYWSSTEFLYYDYLDSHVFWVKSGNKLKWSPSPEEKDRYEKNLAMFQEAIAEA